jgi:hypothetical protein
LASTPIGSYGVEVVVEWHRLGRLDGYDFNGQISWSASATGSGTR